ncbi:MULTISPECIES: hypothetical protein [Bacillus cereus group]|uniref:Uncharacterized protein n=1 Tax=Bacillus mycoides TaxID=1405 RepID=A0A1G4EFT3_BACMY|nr:hypothetical protein [Bacillus mycoides]MCQ6360483.1 hypothetical protein [Bacillus cereus]SCB66784.1 Uncharacterized protein BWGO95_00895 [Bacillus mycoides]
MIEDISKVKNNTEILRGFLAENFYKLETEGGSGSNLSFPNFDLFARDYLLFAEHEILQLKNNLTNIEHVHLINCVSHLRRAIDCQLDICLDVLKIKVFKKKNLSLEAKLKFFEEAGVFSSFSLSRFNRIRNKMEHGYQLPKIEDIETYFDLVSAFISVLESMLSFISHLSEVNFILNKDNSNTNVYFSIWYSFDDIPSISYQISESEKLPNMQDYADLNLYFEEMKKRLNDEDEDNDSIEVTVTVKERDDFPYFLKVLLLLGRKDSFVSDKYIFNELTK